MNMGTYLKPWIFALIGGVLIIGATALSGIVEDSKQLKLEGVRNEIAKIGNVIKSAEMNFLRATLKSDLGYIQRTVEKCTTPLKSMSIEQANYIHALHIKNGIFLLHMATGTALTAEIIEEINTLSENVKSGDMDAYGKLQIFSIELTSKFGQYINNLFLQKEKNELRANEISKEIASMRIVSVLFQLLGLVILLLKEFPESLLQEKQHG